MPWSDLSDDVIRRFVMENAAATWVVVLDNYRLNVPEWTALTGQSAEEANGDGWLKAVHPDDSARALRAWITAQENGSPLNVDYRLRCADGAYRWFNARGMPIPNQDGESNQWMGLLLSIPGTFRPSRFSVGRNAPATHFTTITPGALRAARAMLGMSADQLAKEAGVARSTIHRLESEGGEAAPRRDSIDRILKVFARNELICFGNGETMVGVAGRHETEAGQSS